MKNSNNLLRLISLQILTLFFVTSCDFETKRFKELMTNQSIEHAKEFKEQFPDSEYLAQVDSLLHRLHYQKSRKANDINEYVSFLDRYPNSVYKDTILPILSELTFKKAKETSNNKLYTEYIHKYPNGEYYEEALNELFRNNRKGTFSDPRDGKIYKWVKVGNTIWMNENLNYSYPFDEIIKKNNRFWNRAYCAEKLEDACPPGWEIPDNDDWIKLATTSGAIPRGPYGWGTKGYKVPINWRVNFREEIETSFDYIRVTSNDMVDIKTSILGVSFWSASPQNEDENYIYDYVIISEDNFSTRTINKMVPKSFLAHGQYNIPGKYRLVRCIRKLE